MDKNKDLPKKLSAELADKFQVENNTLKRDVKENPKDRIELEIGDSKQPDFKPQAKIMRWDNEVNASFRYVDPEPGDPTIETEGNVVKYVKPKVEFHAYELDPAEGLEDGGLEIELLLKEKPDTNKFDFTIQTKGLDFFYQPALTQQEIDEGASRPDDVVGSYAVYHATKGGMNDVAGMEYKVGKAFHIYRPFAHDANGDGIWCDLNVDTETGILSVTIDQAWLEKAVYPVVVDPTFGYTSIGGSLNNWSANTVFLFQAELTENGDISSLHTYSDDTSGSLDAKGLIYVADGSDYPTDQEAVSSPITINTTDTWRDYTVSVSLAAGTYYLGAVNSASAHQFRWDTAGTLSVYADTTAGNYTTPPDPYPSSDIPVFTTRSYSIYATYTAAGGGGTPADKFFNFFPLGR